jgi:hypothetical protein
MGHNDHLEDFRPELPPEAGEQTSKGFEPDDKWLQMADPSECHEAMRCWFLSRYWDPANDTPYISQDGGYQYIHGGPFNAKEELYSRFGHIFDDNAIRKVIDDVESNGIYDWAPIYTEHDYDEDFEFSTPTVDAPHKFFQQHLQQINSLLQLESTLCGQSILLPLLYTSLITALEAYLSETFSFWVRTNDEVLKRFVERCEEFKLRKFALSDIFSKLETLRHEVESYLQVLVWHRLDKVVPLFSGALSIDKPPIGRLMKLILTRHDIIHRGGKSKDGKTVVISRDDFNELHAAIIAFVDDIEGKLRARNGSIKS